jgi:hypothetical protein
MLERLDLLRVRFEPEDIFSLYDSPRKGAEEVARELGYGGPDPYTFAYRAMVRELGHMQAPPRYERRINIQEIETCLCKYHSHLGGHYEVGKDIHEVRHGLLRFGRFEIAQRLLRAGKEAQLW